MKNNLKKFAAILSLCATFSAAGSVFAENPVFVDMPEDNTKEALEAAVDNGLLNGYETDAGTEIRPAGNITRAEMGTILVRAMGATKEEDISDFVDMSTEQWHYSYMSKAVAMGAFKGNDENKLNPEANITFQEAFIVLSRIFDLADRKSDDDSDPFEGYYDANEVADWAKEDVGLILKYDYWYAENGYLRPTEYITRAEFSVLMHNLVKTYIDEEDVKEETVMVETKDEEGNVTETETTIKSVSDIPKGNVVIRVGDVTIKDYNDENSDIYMCDGITSKITFNNCFAHRIVARNGNIDFIDGHVGEIRMLTPGCSCYLGGKVDYFDGHECHVTMAPVTI